MLHHPFSFGLLSGRGLEIGPSQRPLLVVPRCTVVAVDWFSRAEIAEYFPELPQPPEEPRTVVDLDGEGLPFADGEFDFVICAHAIARVANPIRLVGELFRVLRPGGRLLIATLDKTYSFDKRRPITPWDHLLQEYQAGVRVNSDEHYLDFLRGVHRNVLKRDAAEVAAILRQTRNRRETAHVWDSPAFRDFLRRATQLLGINAITVFESLGEDNGQEYWAVWEKFHDFSTLHDVLTTATRQLMEQDQQHRQVVAGLEGRIHHLHSQIADLQQQMARLYASQSWRVTEPLRRFYSRVHALRRLRGAHHHLAAQQGRLAAARWMWQYGRAHGIGNLLFEVDLQRQGGRLPRQQDVEPPPVDRTPHWLYPAIVRDHRLLPNQEHVDVIVCVHNALDDVQRCLASVLRHTLPPYQLIIVDDGSAAPTADYLADFAAQQGALLIRNEQARGYTLAANQGLRAATGHVVLLNSDTIVGPQWLDRLMMCAHSDAGIGIVGPLSNTASWQSIPEIEVDGDWASNPLPEGWSVARMAQQVAADSHRLYPRMSFLNGFCLLIKRGLINAIGLFDEATFARGYGEENDYCLRARAAGWQLALADDTYVFHAQSKSYSHERRKQLADAAGQALVAKHGAEVIEAGVAQCRHDPVLAGLRARARRLAAREALLAAGRARWEGLSMVFVMPIMVAGGGGNVVVSEARALLEMGVDVRILNLGRVQEAFEDSYPDLGLPVIYADDEQDFARLAAPFDVVVATANHTVEWLAPLAQAERPPILAYYVQDYEPLFYPETSPEYRIAFESYSLIPQMRLFTKTAWTQAEVREKTGKTCAVVGCSYAGDLFMPRPRAPRAEWPVRILAMIRPTSPRRAPELTMQVLGMIADRCRDKVEIIIFGVDSEDPHFLALPRDFRWQNRGLLTPQQMAHLLNEVDIFADFSTFQAMGLTALEAMSCGVAVVVPQAGGAAEFARDEENALVIDTLSTRQCLEALARLIDDADLRRRLQQQALADVVQFAPEVAAYKILQAVAADWQPQPEVAATPTADAATQAAVSPSGAFRGCARGGAELARHLDGREPA